MLRRHVAGVDGALVMCDAKAQTANSRQSFWHDYTVMGVSRVLLFRGSHISFHYNAASTEHSPVP